MTSQEKLCAFADILDIDVDQISEDTALDTIDEWDSLAAVMLNSYMHKHYGKHISGNELRNFRFVNEVLAKFS